MFVMSVKKFEAQMHVRLIGIGRVKEMLKATSFCVDLAIEYE